MADAAVLTNNTFFSEGLRALAVRYEYGKLSQWLEKGETDNG